MVITLADQQAGDENAQMKQAELEMPDSIATVELPPVASTRRPMLQVEDVHRDRHTEGKGR